MRTRGHTQMVRSRIPLAASVLLFSVHCTTSQAPPGELSSPRESPSAALTVGSVGNGPHAMVICSARSGNDCNTGNNITNVTQFNTAIAPRDAWFATAPLPIGFGAVHSWALGRAINFWSYTGIGTVPAMAGPFFGPDADMDIDDRSMFPLDAQTVNNQARFERLFTGFIALPATASTTRTFAVAADDGYFLT
ncbi:MAG: hypothetical protein ACJ79P_13275, partial [Myxococcales bacterium]